MHVLIGIALKSLLIAVLTLALLAAMRHRSAAERSWVAHIGLLALVIMAFAPLVMPRWDIPVPALTRPQPATEAVVGPASSADVPTPSASADTIPLPATPAPSSPRISGAAAATAIYAIPAAILLFITLLALGRLITLRARADVLVDGHWLSALARAQRRMGFKHGTALLTSDELSSPISWGLMRPVILLNNQAVEAAGEAEAIIAHELAHVARMDWIKLLLARVATALYWFNPFVWLLAREAHQLREEAADDAVLAADIVDTDYAQLLVGVARHECPGLLLGAHGVAPSKSSLARRVARVLDGKSVRGPAARSFALGVFVGAVLIAAPLAAITLTPAVSSPATRPNPVAPIAPVDTSKPYYVAADAPSDLGHIIASGVSTSVATVSAVVAEDRANSAREARADAIAEAVESARDARQDALREAHEAVQEARQAVRIKVLSNGEVHQAIHLRAAGVSGEYVDGMRAAVPRFRNLDPSAFSGLKAVGVTPEYAHAFVAVGFRNISAEELTSARAVGMSPGYARALVAAGVPMNIEDYVRLHAVGVPPTYVQALRKAGYSVADADKLVEMYAVGVRPSDLRGVRAPPSPRPPNPPPDPDEDPDDG